VISPRNGNSQRNNLACKDNQRKRLAIVAARFVAEDGVEDLNLAKRKAANQLGLPESVQLPENSEVEEELRIYLRLFRDEEQNERIGFLRRKARELMAILQKFNPYLTGAVLEGTAGRFAEIDIQLFTDTAKDVEIFLLNQKIDFEHSVPRSERAEAVLTLHNEGVVANLIVYPSKEERIAFKTRSGKIRRRIQLGALERMLETESAGTP